VQKDVPSSASIIFMTPDGRRTVFNERTTHGKFDHFPHGVPLSKALYIGHLDEIEMEIFDHLESWKNKNPNSIIAWNPGKTQFKRGLNFFKNIFPLIDLLILNVEEAELFTGKKSRTIKLSDLKKTPLLPTKNTEITDVQDLASVFINAGVKQVFITDGIHGAQYFDSEGVHIYSPSYEDMTSVSTLGAGDSFSVGVVTAFLKGKNPATQLLWGSANAGSVVQKFGAQEGQLTLKEIKKVQ
jgi:sugar/nucleoside kinase (ribokinase family)